MREIDVSEITSCIRQMCMESNYFLEDDVKKAIYKASEAETSDVGRSVLAQLKENMKIAENERIPVCQDTGMAVVFLDLGQDVHLTGGDITEAVNEGVRQGYTEGYLRKSVVADPIERINTGDNTPAVIHFNIVPGDKVEITFAPKGFGSENMSRIFMLKPADGLEGVKRAIVETAREAGPNACPPFFIGVGIGGDFEKCAIMAKRALTRSGVKNTDLECTNREGISPKRTDAISTDPIRTDEESTDSEGINPEDTSPERKGGVDIRELERELLNLINETGLGPAGLGGRITALAVNVEVCPTHIAGLPVAVCMCCHVNRHKHAVL